MGEVAGSFHLLPCRSVPLPSPFPAQLNRYSGEMCFQLPHVFWLVVALLLTFTVIFPIPIVVLVINLKQFRVRMQNGMLYAWSTTVLPSVNWCTLITLIEFNLITNVD